MDIQITDGLHVHVRSQGEGDHATLLIHGWSLSGRVWDEVVQRWPKDLGRLVVPDLRGSGWSAKPRTGYSLDAYAADMAAVVHKLGLKKVAVVGHSMGGAIAQLVALNPEVHLSRLVLVSPVPASGVPLPPEAVGFFRAGAGHRDGCAQVLRSAMARDLSDAARDKLLADAATVSTDAYLEGLDAWRNASFADRIGAIKAPTVVLGGDAEPYLPHAFLNDAVVSKIPGATLRNVPGAGHYPMLETPDALCEVLFSSLRG